MLFEKIKSPYDLRNYDIIVIAKKMYIIKHFLLDDKNVTEDWRFTIWLHDCRSGEVHRRKIKEFANTCERGDVQKLLSLY